MDGANAFSNMAQALVINFKSVRAASETRGIVDGLNIVMKASVDISNEVKLEQSSDEIKDWIDDSNEARNKQYQEKVRKVDSGIQLCICNKLFSTVLSRAFFLLGPHLLTGRLGILETQCRHD